MPLSNISHLLRHFFRGNILSSAILLGQYLHHNVGWMLELMYAGCDSSLIARVCWLPSLKVACHPTWPGWSGAWGGVVKGGGWGLDSGLGGDQGGTKGDQTGPGCSQEEEGGGWVDPGRRDSCILVGPTVLVVKCSQRNDTYQWNQHVTEQR